MGTECFGYRSDAATVCGYRAGAADGACRGCTGTCAGTSPGGGGVADTRHTADVAHRCGSRTGSRCRSCPGSGARTCTSTDTGTCAGGNASVGKAGGCEA